jgi:ABC-2 type transport system permease protein
MKGLLAVYRREMGGYFVSPIAYIVVGLFLLVAGYFFYDLLDRAMKFAQSPQMGQQEFDVTGVILRNFFGIVTTISLFMVPMLTMGIYSEERKRGTMELLMTSPLTEFQIVAAKFFAVLTVFLAMLAPTLIYQIIMGQYSEPAPPWKVMWSGYLGLVLLGAVLVAIGSFISSLTESQIIAGVGTFAVFLLLWVLDSGAGGATGALGDVLQYLSVLRHFDDFSRGIIDTSSVIFYVSMAVLGVFLTLRSIDSMRWRRA